MSYFKRILQDIKTSASNSTTTNLAAAATFTGTAEETFGINGIQVYHYADQDCTIYIDQGFDGSNWGITDSFDCLANNGCTRTFTSVAPYFRMRVTNNGTATTTDITTATGLTPIIAPLPRALDNDRVKVQGSLIDEESGSKVTVDPLGALKTFEFVRLVGTAFDGTTKDTNFWTETVTGSGTVTQAGEVTLATGTTADSTAQYDSVRRARKVPGASNEFRAVVRLVSVADADNLRRIGAYDTNDGFFFQLNGTTFGVGSRKATSDTIVNSGSFNGNYGPSVTLTTSVMRMSIIYTAISAKFYLNNKLLHTITASSGSLTNTLTLPIRMMNANRNGGIINNSFEVYFATIGRLGKLETATTYKFIGTNTTTICKYGAGELTRIVNLDNAGTVTVYDNTAASGTQMAVIDTAKALGNLDFEASFNNGLTIVTSGGAKITVVYE